MASFSHGVHCFSYSPDIVLVSEAFSLCRKHTVAFQEANDFTESLQIVDLLELKYICFASDTDRMLKWGKGLWSFYLGWQSVTNIGVSGSICGGDCLPAWIRGSKSGPKLLPSDTIAIRRTKTACVQDIFFVVMFLWGSNHYSYCCEKQVLWPNWPGKHSAPQHWGNGTYLRRNVWMQVEVKAAGIDENTICISVYTESSNQQGITMIIPSK